MNIYEILSVLLLFSAILFSYCKLHRKIKRLSRKIEHCDPRSFYEDVGLFVKNNRFGKHSYACHYFTVASEETTVGKFCSIADNVSLGTTFHPTDYLSTHPFTYFSSMRLGCLGKQESFVYKKPVQIGNDVWIGKGSVIMDGISVGDGAIIGTHAVVTHDVPPYAIVVGVPARVLRYRFDKNTIKDLLNLRWWELDDNTISKLPFSNIQNCIKELKRIRGREK